MPGDSLVDSGVGNFDCAEVLVLVQEVVIITPHSAHIVASGTLHFSLLLSRQHLCVVSHMVLERLGNFS